MKKLLLLLLTSTSAFAQVKISQLPQGYGANVLSGDVLPYVENSDSITKKIDLIDMVNIPAWVTYYNGLYAPIISPTFSGTLTCGGPFVADSSVEVTGFGTGLVHSNSGGVLSSSTLINADVSASASIAYSKLAAIPTGSILLGNAGVPTIAALSGGAGVSASGVVTLGNPGPSTLGGVESLASTSHQWINQISTAGVPSATQPAFSDVSGQTTLSQLPTIAGSTILGNNGSSGVPIALSAAQALAEISPLTTKGDLAGFSTVNTRLPVGSDGQFLQSLSSQATGLNWQWGLGNVQAEAATYAVLNTDDLVTCNAASGAFTVTLPTAVGISGKRFRITKSDSTFNLCTIATTSSQSFNPSGAFASGALATQGESIVVESDGSNWQVNSRFTNTSWATYAWSPSSGTPNASPTTNLMKWRRVGDSIEIIHSFYQTTGNSSGSTLQFNLPTGLTINTSSWGSTTSGAGIVGGSAVGLAGSTTYFGATNLGSSTSFTATLMNGTTIVSLGNSPFNLGNASAVAWSVMFKAPITNWN